MLKFYGETPWTVNIGWATQCENNIAIILKVLLMSDLKISQRFNYYFLRNFLW